MLYVVEWPRQSFISKMFSSWICSFIVYNCAIWMWSINWHHKCHKSWHWEAQNNTSWKWVRFDAVISETNSSQDAPGYSLSLLRTCWSIPRWLMLAMSWSRCCGSSDVSPGSISKSAHTEITEHLTTHPMLYHSHQSIALCVYVCVPCVCVSKAWETGRNVFGCFERVCV